MSTQIQRLLVPLDPSRHADAATTTACFLAREHKATVSGITVLDRGEIATALTPIYEEAGHYVAANIIDETIADASAKLDDCLEKFEKRCEEERVPHLETRYTGIPSREVLRVAGYYDLLVMGVRTFFEFEVQNEPGNTLDRILDLTVTPVLAVPEVGLKKVERVLVAHDGSPASTRSLREFAAFARAFEPHVTVLVAGRGHKESRFLLEEASAFLHAHGIRHIDQVESERPIKEYVDDELVEKADLVVAGIHSRKFLVDRFVGSFTKGLIARGDKPLFLSH